MQAAQISFFYAVFTKTVVRVPTVLRRRLTKDEMIKIGYRLKAVATGSYKLRTEMMCQSLFESLSRLTKKRFPVEFLVTWTVALLVD